MGRASLEKKKQIHGQPRQPEEQPEDDYDDQRAAGMPEILGAALDISPLLG